MPGIVPVSGDLSMEDLAATLTKTEQLDCERVTGLAIDTTQARNLATTVNDDQQLSDLAICAAGASSAGTKLLSTTAYIGGKQTEIDLYRLP